MKLAAYKEAFILGLAELNNYRADMWFQLFSKLISLIGLGVLWYWLLRGSSEQEIRLSVGYLLVANGVRELVDAYQLKFGGRLMDEIKDGSISSSLVRPIVPYRLSYFIFFGTRGTNYIFGWLLIFGGVLVNPPVSIINYGYFILVILLASVISYQLNIMTGFLSFWFIEAASMRSLLVHTTRVLSGSMIPLTYFPELLRNIALITPFPILAYLPSKVVQNGLMGYEGSLLASGLWVVIFFLMEKKLWIWGVKRYEAVGI